MSLLNSFFGRKPPRPLGELRDRAAELYRSGQTKVLMRELQAHRDSVEHHYANLETEKLYQTGVSHLLALASLYDLAGDQEGREQYDTLRAFFASYAAALICLGRARKDVTTERQSIIKDNLSKAELLYEGAYATMGDDLCLEADTEANEIISEGLRRAGIL